MPRFSRHALSAAGLFALIATTTLLTAQENIPSTQKKAEAKKALPGESNPSTTLYLVLRTGPDEVGEEIVRNIEKALKATKAGYAGTPAIKAVSPTFFEEFAGLIDQAAGQAESEVGTLNVKRLASRETAYELSINPEQVLKKLSVKYSSGKDEDYVPASPGEKSPLTLIVPGKYAFAPPAGETPKTYSVTVGEFGKKDLTKTSPWPVSDKYFVVTLKSYVGNKDELFAALRNPAVVASPFDVKRADDLLFAFAGLNSTAVGTDKDDRIDVDSISITAEDLPERNVRRVWSYFPLDDKDAKKALAEFRKDGMRSVELSKAIREKSVMAKDKSAITSSTEPKWFELEKLPPNERTPKVSFSRQIKVESLRSMYERFPSLYRLVVWEFDDGVNPAEAILIEVKGGEGGKAYVEEREILAFRRRAEAELKKFEQNVEKKK